MPKTARRKYPTFAGVKIRWNSTRQVIEYNVFSKRWYDTTLFATPNLQPDRFLSLELTRLKNWYMSLEKSEIIQVSVWKNRHPDMSVWVGRCAAIGIDPITAYHTAKLITGDDVLRALRQELRDVRVDIRQLNLLVNIGKLAQ